jgi:hypothetical protein
MRQTAVVPGAVAGIEDCFPEDRAPCRRAFAIFAALRHSIACWIRWTMDRPALFFRQTAGFLSSTNSWSAARKFRTNWFFNLRNFL